MEQIQLIYQPVQDRMVLLIRTKEDGQITLWLTRRVTKSLLTELKQLTEQDSTVMAQANPQNRQHVMNFQQQTAADKSKFERNKTDMKALMEEHPPQLVAGVKLDAEKVLRMPVTDGRTLNLTISTQLAYVVTNLINAALKQTDWQIGEQPQTSSLEYTHQRYPTMTLN